MRLYLLISLSSGFSPTIRLCKAANFSVPAFALPSQNNNLKSTINRFMGTDSKSMEDKNDHPVEVDPEYPGTAIERMLNIRQRVKQLGEGNDLSQPWEEVRRKLLWAGGLRDLTDATPGQGYTGHSFNDFNHVDLTAMLLVDNQNKGEIAGIARGNFLGNGIRIASLPELGPGGSWSTCALGCNQNPPNDVAHIQFKSRIAFKLVWVPNENFDTFVLVDDDGKLLAKGKPSDGPAGLPRLKERQYNYQIVAGSKYGKEAEALARQTTQQ